MPWLNASALAVHYKDIEGREYTTHCEYDKNSVTEGHTFVSVWPAPEDPRIIGENKRRHGF
jgi:hypothetical protein